MPITPDARWDDEGEWVKPSIVERFWSKVDKSGECWLWCAGLNHRGYGLFTPRHGKRIRAHRFAYRITIGPIPPGMEIDHVRARGCTSTACVNPRHLEAVPQRINNLRSESPSARHARQTHCVHGHPFDIANTRIDRHGARRCRACERTRKTAKYWMGRV